MSWYSPTSLRRITLNGRYVPEIDGLRFVAIATVMLHHVYMLAGINTGFQSTSSQALNFLYTGLHHAERGVLIFFAISGMVLGLPFARHRLLGEPRVRLGPYLMRRLTRLEPPYIANLILLAPIVAVVKHLRITEVATHFAVSLFYADWLVYNALPAIHHPSWSLAIEVQFYLLAPLLAVAIFHENTWVRRSLSVALIAAFSLIAGHLPGLPQHTALRLSFIGFAEFFLVGMLCADIYLMLLPKLRQSYLWDAVALPLWFTIFLIPEELAVYVMPPILLILIPAAFLGPLERFFFRLPFVSTVGGMCYSIYLTHSLILQGVIAALAHVVHLPRPAFLLLAAVVGISVSLFVGTVFFVLIERPCMDRNWPTKLRNRLRSRPSVTAA